MTRARHSRREFFKASGKLAAAGMLLPAWLGDLTYGAKNVFAAANDRPRVGSIGVAIGFSSVARSRVASSASRSESW